MKKLCSACYASLSEQPDPVTQLLCHFGHTSLLHKAHSFYIQYVYTQWPDFKVRLPCICTGVYQADPPYKKSCVYTITNCCSSACVEDLVIRQWFKNKNHETEQMLFGYVIVLSTAGTDFVVRWPLFVVVLVVVVMMGEVLNTSSSLLGLETVRQRKCSRELQRPHDH